MRKTRRKRRYRREIYTVKIIKGRRTTKRMAEEGKEERSRMRKRKDQK